MRRHVRIDFKDIRECVEWSGKSWDDARAEWLVYVLEAYQLDEKTANALVNGEIRHCKKCLRFHPNTTEYFILNTRSQCKLTYICHQCRKDKKSRLRDCSIYAANREARKRGLRNDFTAAQRRFALDYWNNTCAYCQRQFFDLFGERKLAFDHYIPLSNLDCPGTTASNLLPCCHGKDSCNLSKSARDPNDWLLEHFGPRRARAIIDRIETYFAIVRERNAS